MQNPDDRLIDYFIVVGVPSTATGCLKPDEGQQDDCITATLLQRWPAANHSDFELPFFISQFCLPAGVKVGERSSFASSTCFFSFVLTDEAARHRFGSCFCFLEPFGDKWVNKVMCLISQWPFYSLFKEFLENIHLHSCHPEQSHFSLMHTKEDFLSALAATPVPPQGVEVTIPLCIPPLRALRPSKDDLPYVDEWCFQVLFSCLSPDNIATVLTAILMEQHVLIHSNDLGKLSAVPQALLALLYPLPYPHVFIPLLPLPLIEYLQAPVPFIMGIHSAFLCTHAGIQTLPSSLVVHVDQNSVILPLEALEVEGFSGADSFPPLPSVLRKQIVVGCHKANEIRLRKRKLEETLLDVSMKRRSGSHLRNSGAAKCSDDDVLITPRPHRTRSSSLEGDSLDAALDSLRIDVRVANIEADAVPTTPENTPTSSPWLKLIRIVFLRAIAELLIHIIPSDEGADFDKREILALTPEELKVFMAPLLHTQGLEMYMRSLQEGSPSVSDILVKTFLGSNECQEALSRSDELELQVDVETGGQMSQPLFARDGLPEESVLLSPRPFCSRTSEDTPSGHRGRMAGFDLEKVSELHSILKNRNSKVLMEVVPSLARDGSGPLSPILDAIGPQQQPEKEREAVAVEPPAKVNSLAASFAHLGKRKGSAPRRRYSTIDASNSRRLSGELNLFPFQSSQKRGRHFSCRKKSLSGHDSAERSRTASRPMRRHSALVSANSVGLSKQLEAAIHQTVGSLAEDGTVFAQSTLFDMFLPPMGALSREATAPPERSQTAENSVSHSRRNSLPPSLGSALAMAAMNVRRRDSCDTETRRAVIAAREATIQLFTASEEEEEVDVREPEPFSREHHHHFLSPMNQPSGFWSDAATPKPPRKKPAPKETDWTVADFCQRGFGKVLSGGDFEPLLSLSSNTHRPTISTSKSFEIRKDLRAAFRSRMMSAIVSPEEGEAGGPTAEGEPSFEGPRARLCVKISPPFDSLGLRVFRHVKGLLSSGVDISWKEKVRIPRDEAFGGHIPPFTWIVVHLCLFYNELSAILPCLQKHCRGTSCRCVLETLVPSFSLMSKQQLRKVSEPECTSCAHSRQGRRRGPSCLQSMCEKTLDWISQHADSFGAVTTGWSVPSALLLTAPEYCAAGLTWVGHILRRWGLSDGSPGYGPTEAKPWSQEEMASVSAPLDMTLLDNPTAEFRTPNRSPPPPPAPPSTAVIIGQPDVVDQWTTTSDYESVTVSSGVFSEEEEEEEEEVGDMTHSALQKTRVLDDGTALTPHLRERQLSFCVSKAVAEDKDKPYEFRGVKGFFGDSEGLVPVPNRESSGESGAPRLGIVMADFDVQSLQVAHVLVLILHHIRTAHFDAMTSAGSRHALSALWRWVIAFMEEHCLLPEETLDMLRPRK